MKTAALLDKKTEVKALRLLQKKDGPSKGFSDIWKQVRQQTIEFVLNQPEVMQKLKGTRHAVVGADLRLVRPARRGKLPQRVAEVGVYDYTRNVLMVHAVDLRKATLLGVEERKGVQPPISASELEEAKGLVLEHNAYRKLTKVSRLQVNAFQARVSFLHDHPVAGHRVFTLVFWSAGKSPKQLGTAVVDLSDRRVLNEDADDDRVIAAMMNTVGPHDGRGGD